MPGEKGKQRRKEVKQMKDQMDELQIKVNAIDTERNKVSDQMRKLKEKYNVMVHSDMVGKCFKLLSWSQDEVEGRHGEKPYWMYVKILSLYQDDRCLTEEFHMTNDTDMDKKHPRVCFSYTYNDRTFICFFKGKTNGIEYTPISEKEYNIALLKCIQAMRKDILGDIVVRGNEK